MEMKKVTKQELETLNKNKSFIWTAYHSKYTLPLYQSELIKLQDLYTKYVDVNTPSISCPKCILKILTALYPLAEYNGIWNNKEKQ